MKFLITQVFMLLLPTSYFFLSFLVWPILPNHCRCSRLLLHLITLRHTTLVRTPLGEGSARRKDLTTHNTHKKHTPMTPTGFEPAIPASKRVQIHVLNRVAIGIGLLPLPQVQIYSTRTQTASTHVLPFGSETKFHTHIIQQVHLGGLVIG
jgi:hypothetical protein